MGLNRLHLLHSTRHCSIVPSPSRTSALPIPGKKYNNNNDNHRNTNRSSSAPSTSGTPTIAPWQQRSITLHDQCYKLPELMLARIESVSNAKIETHSTPSPHTNIHDTSSPE